MVFQQKSIHWRTLIRYVHGDVREFLASQEDTYTNNQHRGPGPNDPAEEMWKRPPNGWLKCNYDGAFHNHNDKSSAGWILRDDTGAYRGSGHAADAKPNSALEGEFQALIMAMQQAWIKGHRKIIFEGDCKNLVDLVNNGSLNFGVYNWIREVWYWKSKFDSILFTWVPRNANRAADCLAKRKLTSSQNSMFYFNIPWFLSDVIHNESLLSS